MKSGQAEGWESGSALSLEEVAARKAFLEFDDEDAARLAAIHDALNACQRSVTDGSCHFSGCFRCPTVVS